MTTLSSSQLESPRLTLVSSTPSPYSPQTDTLDPLHVLQAINVSLELDRVLATLDSMLHEAIGHSGWGYDNATPEFEAPGLRLRGGREDRHRIEYALSFNGSPMGTFILWRGRRFAEAEQARIESLLGLACSALHNALRFRALSEQLERDPLTGLGNRRALHSQGEQWLADCRRQERPLSVLALDLDRFKEINDRFGHAQGDQVLSAIAQILRGATRFADLCVRLGGDEFLVLLPGADLGCALDCAERIRTAVAALVMTSDAGLPIRLSVSIGVASWRPGLTLDQLCRQADSALYAAKRGGANQSLASASVRESPLQGSPLASGAWTARP